MRKCPVCDDGLVWVEYEGARVMKCFACHGYLVDVAALERIKRNEGKSQDQLSVEVETESNHNSEHELKCPRCRLTMNKVNESLPGIEIELDCCKSCKMIWLDGGGLAKLQLGYEATDQAIQARAMKARVEAFEADPERQAQFAENLAQAPTFDEGTRRGAREEENRQGRMMGRGPNVFGFIADLLFRL
jgi:Zn-finger nucleic acid-binding protein